MKIKIKKNNNINKYIKIFFMIFKFSMNNHDCI